MFLYIVKVLKNGIKYFNKPKKWRRKELLMLIMKGNAIKLKGILYK